jgi:hypothetical protein
MARRSGSGTMFGSLIGIVGALIGLVIAIGLAYFLSYAVEGKVVDSYTSVMNYTQTGAATWTDRFGTSVAGEYTNIKSAFSTGRTALALIAGFLGLILLVVILKGYIMPILGI